MSNNRSAEYRLLINEVIDEHAALQGKGLPGLDQDEWMQLKDIVARIERRLKANQPAESAE